MEVLPLEESLHGQYEAYVTGNPDTLLYHSLKFKNFLTRMLDCRSHYLVCTEPGDRICGVLPLMAAAGTCGSVINSLPFFGSNGGLIADSAPVAQCLSEAYNTLVKKESAAATLIETPFLEQDYTGIDWSFKDVRIAQWTKLPGIDDAGENLMNRIDSSTRRNIRKAMKSEISVEIDNSGSSFLRTIHLENMKELGGKPKPDRFFELVAQCFDAGKDYNIYIAKMGDHPIAALLLFYFNQTVEYYIPVVEKNHRSFQPLSLIIFKAMIDASQNGFTRWNWGGTWISQDGVYRFKKKWGTTESRYHYYTTINNPDISKSTREILSREYPYFYVIPFQQLREN